MTPPRRPASPWRPIGGAAKGRTEGREPLGARYTLTVHLPHEERRLGFTAGRSVREILEAASLHLPALCGGLGTCGRCRLRAGVGAFNEPTATELAHIGAADLAAGVRLACQSRPAGDAEARLEQAEFDLGWRPLSESEIDAPKTRAPVGDAASGIPCGVAIDLGTTQIRLSVWNRGEGRRVAARTGFNPQALFGADVVTRLASAISSRTTAEQLRTLAGNAIGEALTALAGECGCGGTRVSRVLVVGNTAMLTLLAGRNYEKLLRPEHWMSMVDCMPAETSTLRAAWGLDEIPSIELVAPLAGFVGSDLVASVLSSGLCEGPPGSLLIDFGTNSEIALWDGETLWATSAAGGPAFEGCGIAAGMPAVAGAIVGVEAGPGNGERHAPPSLTGRILGDGPALGLAGSAVVDIVALLLSGRFISGTGMPNRAFEESGVPIGEPGDGIRFRRRDIDVFQRAKAAIGGAVEVLSARAGLCPTRLERLVLCGAFGRHLDVRNAAAVGLVPPVAPDRVELRENAALAGCEILLTDPDARERVAALRRRSRVLNLAQDPLFEERFIQNLYLRPLSAKGTTS